MLNKIPPSLDPDRYPTPLCDRALGHNAKKATACQSPRTTLLAARHQSTIKLPCHIPRIVPCPQDVHGIGVQGWGIPQGSREPGQAGGESDDGPGGHGGDDGDDEGKYGHDDTANVDHELDQCLFRRVCHQ